MRRAWTGLPFAAVLVAATGLAQSGTITGVVIDKGHFRPLAGATVRVEGSDRVVTTDSSGHFQIDGVSAGTHRLIWGHPALDSLGLTMRSIAFDVPVNDTVAVSLAKPSPRAVFFNFCGNASPGVLVTGRVTRVDNDLPVAGAAITASWTESAPVGRTSTTDSIGRYHLCVSPAHAILLHAKLDAEARGYLPPSPMQSVLVADLRLAVGGDAVAAALSGRALADSGKPVRGASVTVLGTPASATTAEDGEFHLAGLPAGSQVLVVRGVGMDAYIQTVDLSVHSPRALTVSMRHTPPTLATVKVVASPEQLADTYKKIGFTERQRIGIGRFLTQDDIRRKSGVTTADALNGYGGIYIGDNGDHGINGDVVEQYEATYNPTYRPCTVYIVDGEILGGEDYARGLPPPDQVIAIEIYRQGEPKPVQVSFGADECAEVLVWTKAELTQK